MVWAPEACNQVTWDKAGGTEGAGVEADKSRALSK